MRRLSLRIANVVEGFVCGWWWTFLLLLAAFSWHEARAKGYLADLKTLEERSTQLTSLIKEETAQTIALQALLDEERADEAWEFELQRTLGVIPESSVKVLFISAE